MANSPRKKKLERVVDECQYQQQRYICYRCGTTYSRVKGNFPVSHSPMYRGTGFLPICCDCMDELYEQLRHSIGDDREAMKRICMKFDLYWNDKIYDMMEKTVGVHSRVRNYISKTNLVKYIDKTFDDTIDDELGLSRCLSSGMSRINNGEIILNEEIEVPKEILEFWGEEYDPKFCMELDKNYHRWTDGLEDMDNGEISLYKQISLQEAIITRETAAGRKADSNVTLLNTLLGSANRKPSQKKADDMDSSLENISFGEWIRRWEKDRPIPEPDPEFKDPDNIIRYITVYFMGHLCKMLGIKNTYCKMYEEEIEKMKVDRPEYQDEDDESAFNDIFSSKAGE